MKYLVIIVKGKNNYGAFSPDVPGCVTTGHSREEVEQLMREALAFHLEGILEDGDPLPVPHASPGDPEFAHDPNFSFVYMDVDIPPLAA
jgi:predicted RNase H-like HicB family nuclease